MQKLLLFLSQFLSAAEVSKEAVAKLLDIAPPSGTDALVRASEISRLLFLQHPEKEFQQLTERLLNSPPRRDALSLQEMAHVYLGSIYLADQLELAEIYTILCNVSLPKALETLADRQRFREMDYGDDVQQYSAWFAAALLKAAVQIDDTAFLETLFQELHVATLTWISEAPLKSVFQDLPPALSSRFFQILPDQLFQWMFHTKELFSSFVNGMLHASGDGALQLLDAAESKLREFHQRQLIGTRQITKLQLQAIHELDDCFHSKVPEISEKTRHFFTTPVLYTQITQDRSLLFPKRLFVATAQHDLEPEFQSLVSTILRFLAPAAVAFFLFDTAKELQDAMKIAIARLPLHEFRGSGSYFDILSSHKFSTKPDVAAAQVAALKLLCYAGVQVPTSFLKLIDADDETTELLQSAAKLQKFVVPLTEAARYLQSPIIRKALISDVFASRAHLEETLAETDKHLLRPDRRL